MKCCPKCSETKEASEFGLNRAQADGLQTWCRSCRLALRQANRDKRAEYDRAYNEANKEKRKEQSRAYYEANKERMLELGRAYYEANKEEIAKKKRDYYQTEAGKEVDRRSSKKYLQTEAGRLSRRRSSQAHRARKAGAAGFHDFEVALDAFGHRCALCGDCDSMLTIGHIIPLARGGSNWQFNIRPECQPCNSSKRDRLDEELPRDWWASRPGAEAWPRFED